MAVTSGSVTLTVAFADTIAAATANLSAYTRQVSKTVTNSFSNGTTAGLANKLYAATVTCAAAPVSVDLTTVTCYDGTTGFTTVRALLIINEDTNVLHTVKFGDDGVGTALFLGGLLGTTPQRTIQASDFYSDQKLLGATGFAVDGSHKNVRLDPGANTVSLTLIVAGTS